MAYADDIVLISDDPNEISMMLTIVKTYESASNAKLNEKKSQILSFGNEILQSIGEIKQCKEGERVRHLGFYFDQSGLINNIDEITEGILKKLKILRNLFPNFTTRTNIWKGYAISSLLYQSEVITITESQIKEFEKVECWFLFSNNLNDSEIHTVSDLKKIIPNISLERLELPKKYGGMNLRRIEDIYSASKCKFLMRALKDDKKEKPCNLLLFEKSEIYNQTLTSKHNTIHMMYWIDEEARNINSRWKWFKQANKIYKQIDKDCQFSPKAGDAMYDAEKREVYFFEDQRDVDLYQKMSRTFPIKISEEDKQKLIEKKEKYLWKNKLEKVDKVVSIGHRDQYQTPTKPIQIEKSESFEFLQKVRVTFNQMEQRKLKRINIRNIFKITIDVDVKPKWTDKQWGWMRKGVKLKSLFSNNLKTIARIDDFKRKYLMSYWKKMGQKQPKCELCGKEWHREHLFDDCEVVEKWENKIYGVKGKSGEYKNNKRKKRKEAMMDNSSTNHTFSWIYNWCIWKTYWDVVFQKFKNFREEENQVQMLTKHIKFFERLHLIYSIYSQSKKHTLDTVSIETEQFHFYSLSNQIQKGVLGKNVVKKGKTRNCKNQQK